MGFGEGFMTGIAVGLVAILMIAELYNSSAEHLCLVQNQTGAACQCRIVLGYDKKESK